MLSEMARRAQLGSWVREDGLTNVEIARQTGITRQSVSNVLSKARAKGVRLGSDSGR